MSVPAREATLNVGDAVGPYRIESFLAAGGMGEVYVASDTRLGRRVAIKVLPALHGTDASRLKRFEHEARAMSRLNHPNILTIHDLGHVGDLPYIVMELLEGQTLRALLKSGTIALPRAVEISLQVLRGLAAAHEKGIIHRDLKPANVFVSADGSVKVLDFGLAKLLHPEWERVAEGEDTISLVSVPGTVVGTVGYMSPEQIEGAAADQRSDIFAFGAILYEMVTGHRAFQGDSAVQVLAAILKEEPSRTRLTESGAPPAIVSIITRCLAKRPEARFQSARDLAFALGEVEEAGPPSITRITQRITVIVKERPRTVSAAVVVMLAAAISGSLLFKSAETTAAVEQSAPRVPKVTSTRLTTDGSVTSAALSPRGDFLVYTTGRALRLKHLPSDSDRDLRPIQEERFTMILGFSRDGNTIYFIEEQPDFTFDIARSPLLSDVSQTVIRGLHENIAVWSPSIDFSSRGAEFTFVAFDKQSDEYQLSIVNLDGTNRRIVARSKRPKVLRSPAWSPDNQAIVALETDTNTGANRVLRFDTATGAVSEFCPLPRKLDPTGRWISNRELVASTHPGFGGQLWHLMSGRPPVQMTTDQIVYSNLTAADGRRLVAIGLQPGYHLWRVPVVSSGQPQRITSGVNATDGQRGLAVLPDGRIIFTSRASGTIELWVVRADGSGKTRLTTTGGKDKVQPSLSADGRALVYSAQDSIWIASPETNELRRVVTTDAGLPTISPDKRWIYFTPNGEATLKKVSVDGGDVTTVKLDYKCVFGRLSPDGRYLGCTENPGRFRVLEAATGKLVAEFTGVKGLTVKWAPDSSAFAFVRDAAGAGNVFLQPIKGGAARQLTNFASESILSFAWTPEGDLVCSRGASYSDAFLMQIGEEKP